MDVSRWLDPLLMVLAGLLLLSVTGLIGGYLPYPFGIFLLAIFLTARILHLLSRVRY